MPDYQLHYSKGATDSETVALYADGEILAIGSPQDVQNTAIKLLDMKQVFNSQFQLGQTSYAGSAKTLSQLNAYLEVFNEEEAERLRQQAAELLAEADKLQGRTS